MTVGVALGPPVGGLATHRLVCITAEVGFN
jgi:hypothetical protein